MIFLQSSPFAYNLICPLNNIVAEDSVVPILISMAEQQTLLFRTDESLMDGRRKND